MNFICQKVEEPLRAGTRVKVELDRPAEILCLYSAPVETFLRTIESQRDPEKRTEKTFSISSSGPRHIVIIEDESDIPVKVLKVEKDAG